MCSLHVVEQDVEWLGKSTGRREGAVCGESTGRIWDVVLSKGLREGVVGSLQDIEIVARL